MRTKGLFLLALGLLGGCVSSPSSVSTEAQSPSIEVKATGIYFDSARVAIADVPDLLEDADIPKTQTIHILVDEQLTTLKEARQLMGALALAGYTRPVLVTKRHATSGVRHDRR